MVLDISGSAWRNGSSALGLPASTTEYVSENAPKEVKPQDLGAPPGVRFVHTACGRNHLGAVGLCGRLGRTLCDRYALYSYFFDCVGAKMTGMIFQCGQNVCPEVPSFKSVQVTHGGTWNTSYRLQLE